MLKRADIYGMLSKAIRAAGGQSAFAKQAGVSPQYLCDVVNARRDPGPAILDAIGVERVVAFRMKERP